MRTLLVGLIGGALVFTYFWYRGDVGTIELPGLGELSPPAAAEPAEPAGPSARINRLAEMPAALRAVRAEFATDRPVVRADVGAEIYAGKLIAKPRESADEEAVDAEAAPARDSAFAGETSRTRSLRVARAVTAPVGTRALTIANQVGVVERSATGTMFINLDYDLMDEVLEENEKEAEADTGTASERAASAVRTRSLALRPNVVENAAPIATTRSLSAAQVRQLRPLAFDAGETIRARAMREQSRQMMWRRDQSCPENVDGEYLRANPQVGVTCAIERLRASGEFEYVEPDLIVTNEFASKSGTNLGVADPVGPDDPLYAFQWNYRNQGSGENEAAGGASFEDFWSRETEGSSDIVVAVVDTGLDMTHPDIAASPNVAPGVDMVSIPFYGNDGDGRDRDPSDPGDICDTSDPAARDSFHGTHVAGTIGAVATNDGSGVAGGAWNVTIVPVRALGRCGGLQSDINEAILWAAGVQPTFIETDSGLEEYANPNPADIINLSLGFRAPDGCPRSTQEAIDAAVAAGAIVVAAAGNKGINVDGYGPSGCDNVVTVSAGDGVGALAYYSNWGDKVDVMAPGGDLSADLDGDGRPDGILSTKRSTDCVDPLTGANIGECRYSYENGTSMAAPHVSAAFALLKSAFPDRTNDQLVSIVRDTARTPRTTAQCTGACADTPGGTPVDGQPGMCFRPCGAGLLDLSRAVEAE